MADTQPGGQDAQVAESFAAPFEELVAFQVELEFAFLVNALRLGAAVSFHRQGVIDHQVGGYARIGDLGVLAGALQKGAQGAEVVDHR